MKIEVKQKYSEKTRVYERVDIKIENKTKLVKNKYLNPVVNLSGLL